MVFTLPEGLLLLKAVEEDDDTLTFFRGDATVCDSSVEDSSFDVEVRFFLVLGEASSNTGVTQK